jgi:hypothetical protein
VAKGDRVFFGGNDDSIHPDSFYWVEPGWAAGILWAIVVGGALLGWLLLTLYQSWAVRRGLSAWYALTAGDGKVRTGSWRALWWWVLISYVVLVGGLAASVILQQLFSA